MIAALAVLAAFPCALLPGAAQERAQQPVAVLEDGTRVAVAPGTTVDALGPATPYGRWRDPAARVTEVVDAARERELLAPLRALDFEAWVRRASERGLLRALMDEAVTDEHRGTLYEALRPWGRLLDPLPAGVAPDDRVDLLWELALHADDARQALFVGALEVEISDAHLGSRRRVSLGDWSRALDARRPGVRWAATRVAERQRDTEMLIPLLHASLEDADAWVAEHAAAALLAGDPGGALYRWAYELVTSRDSDQARRAALWLARFARDEAAVAREVADRLRNPDALTGGGAATGCSGGGGLGGAVFATERSVLEVRPASRAVTLTVAEVLERAAEAPRGEEIADAALVRGTPEERGRAWRRHLLGR